jgi:hypothetical protein
VVLEPISESCFGVELDVSIELAGHVSSRWFLNGTPALLRPHTACTTMAIFPESDPNLGSSLINVLGDWGGQTSILNVGSLDLEAV